MLFFTSPDKMWTKGSYRFARFNKRRGPNKVRRGGTKSPKLINVPVRLFGTPEYISYVYVL